MERPSDWRATEVLHNDNHRTKRLRGRNPRPNDSVFNRATIRTMAERRGGGGIPEASAGRLLATLAGVSPSTASAFFADKFQGYAKYRVVCRDAGRLADSLKALNGEFSPHDLYGRRPAGEDDREDEGDE